MDYTSIFTLMRAEVTLTAILVFVFLYDLMAGERARRRFSAVVCCLMVVQVVVNLVPASAIRRWTASLKACSPSGR